MRQAKHMGNTTFWNVLVPNKLKVEFLKNVKHLLEVLLENSRVIFYNGQLDYLSCNYLSKLKWSVTGDYQTATVACKKLSGG